MLARRGVVILAALRVRTSSGTAALEQLAMVRRYQAGNWHGEWRTFDVVTGAGHSAARLEAAGVKAAVSSVRVEDESKRQVNKYFLPPASAHDLVSIARADAAHQYSEVDYGRFSAANLRARYAGPALIWAGIPPPVDEPFPFACHIEFGLVHGDQRRRAVLSYCCASKGAPLLLSRLISIEEYRGAWPSLFRPSRAPEPAAAGGREWTQQAGVPVSERVLPPAEAKAVALSILQRGQRFEPCAGLVISATVAAHAGEPIELELVWSVLAGDAEVGGASTTLLVGTTTKAPATHTDSVFTELFIALRLPA
ncbi:hypothetical protein T492DRAFT_1023570 [Pavlovales sp. CCMP2436]|nr:hypothetical protein T492DRAFT_1023570 [Pavlovales sp. CCMP2436]